jgi:hypothetical protein
VTCDEYRSLLDALGKSKRTTMDELTRAERRALINHVKECSNCFTIAMNGYVEVFNKTGKPLTKDEFLKFIRETSSPTNWDAIDEEANDPEAE